MPATLSCPSCGRESSSGHSFCKFCGATVTPVAPPIGYVPAIPLPQNVERVALMVSRYHEGYGYARAINGFGIFIQWVACIVGGLLVLGGISASSNGSGAGLLSMGNLLTLVGLLLGAFGYIHGVIVRASGQALKAHFDCAIFQSPFLSDDQRAAVMFPK